MYDKPSQDNPAPDLSPTERRPDGPKEAIRRERRGSSGCVQQNRPEPAPRLQLWHGNNGPRTNRRLRRVGTGRNRAYSVMGPAKARATGATAGRSAGRRDPRRAAQRPGERGRGRPRAGGERRRREGRRAVPAPSATARTRTGFRTTVLILVSFFPRTRTSTPSLRRYVPRPERSSSSRSRARCSASPTASSSSSRASRAAEPRRAGWRRQRQRPASRLRVGRRGRPPRRSRMRRRSRSTSLCRTASRSTGRRTLCSTLVSSSGYSSTAPRSRWTRPRGTSRSSTGAASPVSSSARRTTTGTARWCSSITRKGRGCPSRPTAPGSRRCATRRR